MSNNTTLTLSKREYRFKPSTDGVEILEEYDHTLKKVIAEYAIEYTKLFDKVILSKMSTQKLKKLIELCQEVIKEKEE